MITKNFTPEYVVDLIQAYKGNLIQTWITDHRVRSCLEKHLASETLFARAIISTTTDLATFVFDDFLTETNKILKKIY